MAELRDKQGMTLHIFDLGGNAIDTGSAAGRFMLTVIAAAAELERNRLRERTRDAMFVLRQQNRRISARIPFGFDLAPDGRALVQNQAEQAAIATIVRRRASGETFCAIAAALDADGIKPRMATRWSAASVRLIAKRAE
jgi:site-specific DNA recombinase